MTEALSRLRALVRAGGAGASHPVRDLLAQLSDPLDMEAAGALLRGPAAQDQLAAGGEYPVTRIALLGSSTLDPVPNLLTAAAAQRGLQARIAVAGYNQWQLEIAAGAPELAGACPRVVACLLDDSAVFAGVPDPVDVDQVAARCAAFPAELAGWLAACRAALGGLVVLCTVPLSPLRRNRVISYPARSHLDAAWLRMNAAIADLAADQPSTVVLSGDGLAAGAGPVFAADRMRHVAAHAYAPEYLLGYARELARVAAADLGLARKCLVLDLDDTLWGGVVGEQGLAGLRLGGGYPGGAYTEVQALARDLAAQGVLLAACSKNDEPVAAQAVASHPEMLLRPESFVATRINWAPKPDNVRAIAEELNIGLDALVFVDDNPVERGLMRALAPQVSTVELPADPAGYANRLAQRGDFMVLAVTAEDRGRTALYQAEAARRQLGRGVPSLADYLAQLGSVLTVEPLAGHNRGRIVQLFGRTNQFNLTGIRYSDDEVSRHVAAGRTAFYAARLTDRFGDNGLVAAVAIGGAPDGAWRIENVVLSCRVFARAVEDAIAALILRDAAATGAPAVLGSFRRTSRNAKFADFYPRLGFRPVGPPPAADYRHDLGAPAAPPRWIEVPDQEVFRVP